MDNQVDQYADNSRGHKQFTLCTNHIAISTLVNLITVRNFQLLQLFFYPSQRALLVAMGDGRDKRNVPAADLVILIDEIDEITYNMTK